MNYSNRPYQRKQGFLSMLKLMLFMVMVVVGTSAVAQGGKTVTGTVRNEQNEILAGVTITVKGTKIITTSKKDGTFELKNVPETAEIIFTYVGQAPKTIKLEKGQSELQVKMADAVSTLQEVVVNTGLYKRPTGNFTGASKTYSGDQLKTVNPTNVMSALAILEPSVRMEENNALGSDPNALPILQVRGQNNLPVSTQGSVASAATPVSNGDMMSSYLLNPNQPLIILDGFQTTLQTIYDMDINRIASITVLKDAAATTAYGSKAANGVIVVETKQPTVGKPLVSYSVNFNFSAPDLSSYNLMNAEQLLEAQRISGVYADPTNNYNDQALKEWYNYRLGQVKSGVNTYWLAQPVRTGVGTNHSLSMSGGSRAVRYNLNMNYSNGVGVMQASNRANYGLSYTLSYVTRSVQFSNSTSIGYSRSNNTPWGGFNEYATQFPFFKPYDSSGNWLKVLEPTAQELGFLSGAPGGRFTNAAYNAQLAIKDYSFYTSFRNNTNFDWTINNYIRLRAGIGFSSNNPGAEQFFPADHTRFVDANTSAFTDMGTYQQTRGSNSAIDARLSVDLQKRFGKHTIYSSIGFTGQDAKSNSTIIRVSGLPNDYLDQLGMANGYGQSTKPGSSDIKSRNLSGYASISYNYADRYTAEVTGNVSGSSQFGSNNKFAPFWSVGGAWNLDKEKFFAKSKVIQQLRIRATTGITGNQNFAATMSQPTYLFNVLNNYRLLLGATLEAYANPNLKWQQTLKNNIGLTAGLFHGKLNIGFDYYVETTDNLILPLDVAPSTGFVSYQDNLGATRNTGYELSLSSAIISNREKNIFWTLSFNAGHYDNVITKLSPAIDVINKGNNTNDVTQTAPLPRFEVGESMSRIWAVKSLGIDPATGKEVFEKLDGTKTFVWDPNDKQPIGDATATLKGMIGSSLTYKGFSFNINMSYQWGGQMYNQTLVDKIENVNLKQSNADERVLTERWKQPGDVVFFKSLVADGSGGLQQTKSTSRFVQDNNFLEAASISVGYTFPNNLPWVKKLKLSTPKLFVSQNNLFRFATIKTERGTSYPFARSFNFGLSTTF
ncbi:MAG TPA: SusC/RagA family TonB-linked outer membrane protein [Phnomibacter sp.]|nr:SusC/RagA family TonB-linked outer membrane protein [Phnomibacter sp.]